jgi:hypothetical protein
VYYLGDHHHTRGGAAPFREAVDAAMARMDGGTVVFERLCFDADHKARLERLLDGVLTGETDVERTDEGLVLSHDAVAEDELMDGSHATVVAAAMDHPGAVDSFDLGPVHGGRVRRAWDQVTDLLARYDDGGGEAVARRLHRTTASYLSAVDAEYVDYVEAADVDPSETLVVVGAAHNLDRRLAGHYDVERLNADLPPTNEFSAAAKRIDRARNGLTDPVPRASFAHPYTVARSEDRLPTDRLREVREANRSAGGEVTSLVDEVLVRGEDLSDTDVSRTAARDAARMADDHDWVPAPGGTER